MLAPQQRVSYQKADGLIMNGMPKLKNEGTPISTYSWKPGPYQRPACATKPLLLAFAALAMFLGWGCSTTPKPNYQQAMEANLGESDRSLMILKALDAGRIDRARNVAMVPVFMGLESVRYDTIKGTVFLAPEEKQAWTRVARETLAYMLHHPEDWDVRRLDVQAGLRGMHYFLTEPEDARQLNELTQHLALLEQERSKTPTP